MRFSMIRWALCALVLTASLGLVGCSGGGKEFTPEQFKTVTKDMPEAKVTEILGPPRETIAMDADQKMEYWESKGKYYLVDVKGGKVNGTTEFQKKEEYDVSKALAKGFSDMMKKGK